MAVDILNPERIGKFPWGDDSEVFHFRFFQLTDSTNLEARRAFQEGAQEYSVFIAEEQSAGRGSHGRNWHSARSAGLYFSVLILPALSVEESLNLTRLAALAAYDALHASMGLRIPCGRRPTLRIKPPNDILLNDRKVCGVLVESASAGACVLYAVAGFGINVNNEHFPQDLSDSATSLLMECGRRFDRAELVYLTLKSFKVAYNNALRHGFMKLQDRWDALVERKV